MKIKTRSLALITLIASTAVNAEKLKGIVGIGIDSGGDKVGSAFFEDGSKENIHSNGGLSLLAGVSLPLMTGLSLQSTIGYQADSADAENGDMTWRSFPWETTLLAQLGNMTIGGGTVYHFSPELSTSGFLSNLGDFEFDDTLGYQAQIGWSPSINAKYNIGLRYSAVEFERNDVTVNGDSTGLFFKYLF